MFASVTKAHPESVVCKPGCDDCCNVYFELTLIEAFYLSGIFNTKIGAGARQIALARAERMSTLFFEAKQMLKGVAQRPDGGGRTDALDAASRLRLTCPLNEDHGCILYEDRPITCRLYGTPQKIAEKVVSCPLSGFRKGRSYCTVDVDEVQGMLQQYSNDFLSNLIDTVTPDGAQPFFTMPEALQTKFDKEFFLLLSRAIL